MDTSSTPSPRRRCRSCSKCLVLQRRVTRIETEYEYLRKYFLAKTKPPVYRFRGVLKQDKELCSDITQLKITIDTLLRSQLFEVLEA